MSRQSPLRVIARVGRRLSTRAGDGRAFAVVLACTTFAAVLATSGMVAAWATYHERAIRDAARVPVAVTDPARASFWWDLGMSEVEKAYTDVVHLEPLTADAPLPPGLDHWPAPGTVIMSPALARMPGSLAFAAHYGRVVPERIGDAGLADPGERLIYVRPASGATVAWEHGTYASGYGVPVGPDGNLGSALRADPLWMFASVYSALVLIPAVLLLLVATRVGAAARDRRLALLRVLGASSLHRAALLLGAAVRPIAVGAAASAVVLGVALASDLTVPGTSYVLRADDLRAHSDLLTAVGAVTLAGVVAVLLAMNVVRTDRRTNRPAPAARSLPAWTLMVAPIVIVGSAWSYQQATPLGSNVTTLIYYAGLMLTVATVPTFVGALVQTVARLLHRTARARGWAGSIAAARQLLVEPRAIMRLASTLAVVILLAAQVQLWTTKLSAQMIDAERLEERTGASIALVDVRGDPDVVDRTLAVVDDFAEVIAVSGSGDPDEPVRVTGSCTAIKATGLDCTVTEAQHFTVGTGMSAFGDLVGAGQSVVVSTRSPGDELTDPAGRWVTVLALSPDGRELDLAAITRHLTGVIAPTPNLSLLSDSWLTAAQDKQTKGAWFTTFGVFAIAAAAIALAGAALAEFVRLGTSAASWAALGATTRTYLTISGWRILLPLLVATATGTGAAIWLAQPLLLPSEGGQLPGTTIALGIALATVASVIVWLGALRSTLRDARTWRPGTG